MRALVIGGSRFFGKRLVQNLLKEGHLDRELQPSRASWNLVNF